MLILIQICLLQCNVAHVSYHFRARGRNFDARVKENPVDCADDVGGETLVTTL